jgi:hypothetical protein
LIAFIAPTHHLLTTLASSPSLITKKKKLFKYNNALRNPFPGTPYYGVAGHHFIELGFQFMTLQERYPHPKLTEISTEFARRLIMFANGKAPWEEFEVREQRVAVVSSGKGWRTYTREEDEALEPMEEEGGRRYEVWEALDEVFTELKAKGRDVYQELKLEKIMALGRK